MGTTLVLYVWWGWGGQCRVWTNQMGVDGMCHIHEHHMTWGCGSVSHLCVLAVQAVRYGAVWVDLVHHRISVHGRLIRV